MKEDILKKNGGFKKLCGPKEGKISVKLFKKRRGKSENKNEAN